MIMRVSCTADATSDVAERVNKVIQDTDRHSDPARSVKLKDVQGKIEMLKQRGLLKRQEYRAATNSDFQKMFLKQQASKQAEESLPQGSTQGQQPQPPSPMLRGQSGESGRSCKT